MVTKAKPGKAPRQTKTPRQRAEAAHAVEARKVVALDKKIDRLSVDLAIARAEQAQVIARRDYLAKHPDLTPADQGSTQ